MEKTQHKRQVEETTVTCDKRESQYSPGELLPVPIQFIDTQESYQGKLL